MSKHYLPINTTGITAIGSWQSAAAMAITMKTFLSTSLQLQTAALAAVIYNHVADTSSE